MVCLAATARCDTGKHRTTYCTTPIAKATMLNRNVTMARPRGRPLQTPSNRYYLNSSAWESAGEHFCGGVLNCGHFRRNYFSCGKTHFPGTVFPTLQRRLSVPYRLAPRTAAGSCDHGDHGKTGDTGKEHNTGDFSNLTRSVSHTAPPTVPL